MDVKEIRNATKLSQAAFAARYGIAPGTLRQWEQGRAHPTGTALVLLKLIASEPDTVARILSTPAKGESK